MASAPSSRDGRFITVVIVGGYFLVLSLTVILVQVSLTQAWTAWGVPALDPHFGDLAGLVAGIENHDAGRGVGEPNPFDPWLRPYNNPTLWFGIRYLGLNRHTETAFGFIILALYFSAILLVLGRLTRGEGIYAGFAIISPAMMIGVERANVDLILFLLLVLVLRLRRHLWCAAPLLALATLLKYHPAGAFLALFSSPWRRTAPWLAGAFALILSYELLNWKELVAVAAWAPHYAFFTFGSATFSIWLAQMSGAGAGLNYRAVLLTSDIVFLLVTVYAAMKVPILKSQPGLERELFAFRMGAGIYLLSFALGANSDYRMIFFLFCLPLLFRLRRPGGAARRWADTALICGMLFANWLFLSDEYLLRHELVKEAAQWGLAASLSGLARATLAWPGSWLASAADKTA